MNPCAYYVVLFEAYDRLPAQIAQPLNYTWAITLAILAWPVLGQRLTARTLSGILLSYAGVVVLLTQGRLDARPQLDWTGVALALASTIVWAGYWLMNTRVHIDPIGLMAWSFTFGSLFVGALCLLGPGLPPPVRGSRVLRPLGGPHRDGHRLPGVAARPAPDAKRRAHRAVDLSRALSFLCADRRRARRNHPSRHRWPGSPSSSPAWWWRAGTLQRRQPVPDRLADLGGRILLDEMAAGHRYLRLVGPRPAELPVGAGNERAGGRH